MSWESVRFDGAESFPVKSTMTFLLLSVRLHSRSFISIVLVSRFARNDLKAHPSVSVLWR